MSLPARLSLHDAVRISLLAAISPTRQRRLARALESLGLQLPRDAARAASASGVATELLAALPDDAGVQALLEEWGAHGWAFLAAADEGFPDDLREIPDPPLHLFVAGSAALLRDPRSRVAIVGSRAATPAGLTLARTLARDLALADCIVVSGMARGIDGAVHRGALGAGGTTWAVLGTGLDRPYPPEHADLAGEIQAEGLLATEFPPGTPPLPLHFPRRNRILVGLADALVVVEGSEKSGARSSVDHALDQGREVCAVPRDPLHEGSRLPNRLLSEGATPVLSAADVIDLVRGRRGRFAARPGAPHDHAAFSVPAASPARGTLPAPATLADRLIEVLAQRPGCSVEAIASETPEASEREILAALATLELSGRARRADGGRWFLVERAPRGQVRDGDRSAASRCDRP